jgi:hypothetical protein
MEPLDDLDSELSSEQLTDAVNTTLSRTINMSRTSRYRPRPVTGAETPLA